MVQLGGIVYLDVTPTVLSESTIGHIIAIAGERWLVATTSDVIVRRLWLKGPTRTGLVRRYTNQERSIHSPAPAVRHTAIELPEPLVSHDLIRPVQSDGKEVYVRLQGLDGARHRRRVQWLRHEQVDGLVCGSV